VTEAEVSLKKTLPTIGVHLGIENIIENFNLTQGVRLIHNGQVRKEAILDPLVGTTDVCRMTKSEFSKLFD
jgi:hypothetical protein